VPSASTIAKPSLLVTLLCASVVAAYDRTWLARPVSALIPPGGPRPERLSRLKARVLPVLETLVAKATRRGRRAAEPVAPEVRRAPVTAAILTVATTLLAESHIPLRRRGLQDRLVAAYDRLHDEHGVTLSDFCGALTLSERTFRAWRARPPLPPPPAPPSVAPPTPPPSSRDRETGRFALDVVAPGTQLGADTTDVRVLGVDLKLVAAQDLGAREQRLWEAFALDERETSALVAQVIAEAANGREGLQVITDQGTPYVAEAAQEAYAALGLEHAPQREGTPTDKAPVERAFHTAKGALAPLLDLTNQLAENVPTLRRPALARALGTLLIAVMLRVYLAGRRHVGHPLEGQDPDGLRAIIEEQRDRARAEDRSTRLWLEAVHAEYDMPGSAEAFVRRFRRYPLEDLQEAERRFRLYACRCVARHCDRYFAAVVRNVHEAGQARRRAQRAHRVAAAERRRETAAVDAHFAELEAHPERRLYENLDLLAQAAPWPSRFELALIVARPGLRRAVEVIVSQHPQSAADELTRHWRTWRAGHPAQSPRVCDAAHRVISKVITDVTGDQTAADSLAAAVGAMLDASARGSPDNQRPSPSPRLRI